MFYQNFVYLCERDGLAKSNVCKKLGLSENAWKRWENNSTPRRQTVVAVSKFFGVDYENMLHKDISTIDAEETDSIKARQELFENTEMRVLFDAAKDVPAYKLYEVASQLMKWKEDNL